jgi:hypothetical protein
MSEYPLTTATLPDNACYPTTVQALLDLVASYTTLVISSSGQPYIIDSDTPASENIGRVWFQTDTAISGNGTPEVIRWYINGAWLEFAQLSQGDRILVADNSVILAPWGEFGYKYSFSDLGISDYIVTAAPIPPTGLKYKTYVGYWNSKVAYP